ncbi:hypothetical protein [Halobaculum sp. EA56]|uniref:hypothetical protein n=1 Tax=Halobaculum sp. EA56 TaxID=3421648 RepID=UPI003EBB5624
MVLGDNNDRIVLGILGVSIVMLVAMFLGGSTGQILFSYTIVVFFGLYVLLGTRPQEQDVDGAPFTKLSAGLVLLLGALFAALWYFHFQNPGYTDPVYWLGFPRATAVLVYGLWMPPALYMMFAYPYLFDQYIWKEEEAVEFQEMERREAPTAAGGDD